MNCSPPHSGYYFLSDTLSQVENHPDMKPYWSHGFGTYVSGSGNHHCVLGSSHFHRLTAGADIAVEEPNPSLVASCHCLDFLVSCEMDPWNETKNSVVGGSMSALAVACWCSDLGHSQDLLGNKPNNEE